MSEATDESRRGGGRRFQQVWGTQELGDLIIDAINQRDASAVDADDDPSDHLAALSTACKATRAAVKRYRPISLNEPNSRFVSLFDPSRVQTITGLAVGNFEKLVERVSEMPALRSVSSSPEPGLLLSHPTTVPRWQITFQKTADDSRKITFVDNEFPGLPPDDALSLAKSLAEHGPVDYQYAQSLRSSVADEDQDEQLLLSALEQLSTTQHDSRYPITSVPHSIVCSDYQPGLGTLIPALESALRSRSIDRPLKTIAINRSDVGTATEVAMKLNELGTSVDRLQFVDDWPESRAGLSAWLSPGPLWDVKAKEIEFPARLIHARAVDTPLTSMNPDLKSMIISIDRDETDFKPTKAARAIASFTSALDCRVTSRAHPTNRKLNKLNRRIKEAIDDARSASLLRSDSV